MPVLAQSKLRSEFTPMGWALVIRRSPSRAQDDAPGPHWRLLRQARNRRLQGVNGSESAYEVETRPECPFVRKNAIQIPYLAASTANAGVSLLVPHRKRLGSGSSSWEVLCRGVSDQG